MGKEPGDAAETHQAQNLSDEGRNGVYSAPEIRRPLSVPHPAVQTDDLAGAGQQQGQGMIGDLFGAEAGRVDHHDSLPGGVVDVDVIEAVSLAENRLKPPGLAQHLRPKRHPDRHNHVGVANRLNRCFRVRRANEFQFIVQTRELSLQRGRVLVDDGQPDETMFRHGFSPPDDFNVASSSAPDSLRVARKPLNTQSQTPDGARGPFAHQ